MSALAAKLRSMLVHPLTRGMDLDDPATTRLRRRIIREKPFLRRIYDEWYALLANDLPLDPTPALELGSGGGFLSEVAPNVITSDLFVCDGLAVVADAQRLPLPDACLRGIVMVDVFHHIPDVEAFLREATRCVRPGGVLAMIEPWVTTWSKLIYTKLHHEPFDPTVDRWAFPATGPLSAANGALPWIVFNRDRARFEQAFPQWRVRTIQPFMPWRYLLSGGVSMRSLAPAFTYRLCQAAEAAFAPLMPRLGMFAHIVLQRQP